jgi:hypothetical protein
MSRLVGLEPAALRKVLKAGLRQGIADHALRQAATEAFGWNDDPASCDQLLKLLEARGWLIRQGETWKTRLS